MRRYRIALVAVGVLAILAVACAPLPLKDVEQKAGLQHDPNAEFAPVVVDQIQVKIKRGTVIGRYHGAGITCVEPYGDVIWGGGRLTGRDLELANIFFKEMTNADYDVVGDPDRLFDESEDLARAEFRIGGRLEDLKVNLCNQKSFWGLPIGATGDAYVKMSWQVYSNRQRRVVYTAESEGRGQTETANPEGAVLAVHNAFGSAVANFAADPELAALLDRRGNTAAPPGGDPAVDPGNVLRLRRLAAFDTPIQDHINAVCSATVTIGTGGGHGSGFFVAEDGLVITNDHVVGNARFITVQLVNGRELVGEVLRRHRRRDVALVLVEGRGYPVLPVRETPLAVAEEVYAVGTPRLRSLATTVSRGIVSASRFERSDRLPYIQADVDIHGGNSAADRWSTPTATWLASRSLDTAPPATGRNPPSDYPERFMKRHRQSFIFRYDSIG